MKNLFLKLTTYAAIVAFVTGCNNNNSKTLGTIQGKWHNIDGTEKTIEIKGDKWIEDAPVFGKTVYNLAFKNDSIFNLEVVENTNTITFYKEGMIRVMKLKPSESNTIRLAEIGSDGKTEFEVGMFSQTSKKN